MFNINYHEEDWMEERWPLRFNRHITTDTWQGQSEYQSHAYLVRCQCWSTKLQNGGKGEAKGNLVMKRTKKNMEFVDQSALHQKCLADFISVTEHHLHVKLYLFCDETSWFSRLSEISPMFWQEFVAGEFLLQCETLSVAPITNFNSFNRWNQFFEHFLQNREKVESDFAGSSAISYPIGIWNSLINVTRLGSGTKFGK